MASWQFPLFLIIEGQTPHETPVLVPGQDGQLGLLLVEMWFHTQAAKQSVRHYWGTLPKQGLLNTAKVSSQREFEAWRALVPQAVRAYSRWDDSHRQDVILCELPAPNVPRDRLAWHAATGTVDTQLLQDGEPLPPGDDG